ncbi:MAG: hypothetical protein ACFFCQ_17345 [Promethearchaeota archaeon]
MTRKNKEFPQFSISNSPQISYILRKNQIYSQDKDFKESETHNGSQNPFYTSSFQTESHFRPLRWKNGSIISNTSSADYKAVYSKLSRLHQQISSQENHLDSKTVHRNLDLASRLQQWFPIAIIDEAVTELHKTDLTKVIETKSALIRILGYIECVLRIRCRTIPWKTLDAINEEFGMQLTKSDIGKAKFQAIKNNAFPEFFRKHFISESFSVLRGQIAMNIPQLPVNPSEKKEILFITKSLCKLLEEIRQIPKDPEIYGYAIIEMAYKQVTKKRALVTIHDRKMKKQISTAIHYIKKKLSEYL